MGVGSSKAEWSPVDMRGKTVIVTGGNSGKNNVTMTKYLQAPL